MRYGFGVDVGGTTCKMGLFEETGNLVEKWEIRTNTSNAGSEILDNILSSINRKMDFLSIEKSNVIGIGVGVPGPVTQKGERCSCVNLFWKDMPVKEILEQKSGLPIRVANDANVAAMGELWKGSGKGCQSLVLITLGTGVGSGIILKGRILEGVHGAGGEIGHMKVRENESIACNCGKYGCLEQYASARGITQRARMALEQQQYDTLLEPNALGAKAIFDAAKSGDLLGLKLVEELGQVLGQAMANVACVIDPECFIIGGGVSKAGEPLLRAIKNGYLRYALDACSETKIQLAELGNDAGIYGCMGMLLTE
ncbi:MAG: ROK family glucokinase [Lachnospiraceae bacterium]